jgi:hypothetical protein
MSNALLACYERMTSRCGHAARAQNDPGMTIEPTPERVRRYSSGLMAAPTGHPDPTPSADPRLGMSARLRASVSPLPPAHERPRRTRQELPTLMRLEREERRNGARLLIGACDLMGS